MPTAADDDHIIFGFGIGVAPNGFPPFLAKQTLFYDFETGIAHDVPLVDPTLVKRAASAIPFDGMWAVFILHVRLFNQAARREPFSAKSKR